RVQALEERLNMPAAAPVVSMPGAPAAPEPQAGPELLPTIGRSLLGLAGGYFLRALVESGAFPARPGAAIGILYAVAWLVWAARTSAERRVEAAAHALTSVLVLAPLLWESTLRFQALGPWSAALTLLAFTALGLAISW